jgi:hypothetical protein
MDKRAEAALDVLAAHGIKVPEELDSRVLEMPGIGRVEPNEVALPVTLDDCEVPSQVKPSLCGALSSKRNRQSRTAHGISPCFLRAPVGHLYP